MPFVYRKTESEKILNLPGAHDLWTVGFYRPDGTWEAESDHKTAESAANRVHFLHGAADAELVESHEKLVAAAKYVVSLLGDKYPQLTLKKRLIDALPK